MIMVSEVLVATGMRRALERYHELSRHLEERVEARTAEALLRRRQLDAANQWLRQANDELEPVYDQGLYAAHLDMDGTVIRANPRLRRRMRFCPRRNHRQAVLGVRLVAQTRNAGVDTEGVRAGGERIAFSWRSCLRLQERHGAHD